MSHTVSVVVCAYTADRREALRAALRSLSVQTVAPSEVIAVIDHNPGLLEWVREQMPEVRVIPSDHAPGLAGARNTGVLAASGELVAFLDDDARAEPDWLERLHRAYDDPQVVGAGGAVVPEFEHGRPRWMPEEFDWVVGCTYRGLPTTTEPVRNLIGCNMSFRRDALLRAGGFPDGMGRLGANAIGCEETELCIRIQHQRQDAVFIYDPDARVGHRVPAARAGLRYFVTRCRAEGASKAEVARRCGISRATASERAYTRHTLPAGIRAGLRDSLRGDLAGIARAGAIMLGLLATAGGFAVSSPSVIRAGRRPIARPVTVAR
jgi:glycosyltransferase involved in cell wall biosynthesis